MRILLYNWNDNSSPDALESLRRIGHEVCEVRHELKNKLYDEEFGKRMETLAREFHPDLIFSFDYFPVLSETARRCAVRYVSWVYDSPHFTLYSKTVFNECNYIFCFDRLEAGRLKGIGVPHAFHMPLAVNPHRLKRESGIDSDTVRTVKSAYDISFVGSLYNGSNNFYDQIKLPKYYKGFFDGLFRAQMELYGCDLASELLTDAVFSRIKDTFSVDETPELFITKKQYFTEFLRRKITSIERIELLGMLSEQYNVTLFSSQSDDSLDKVCFKGYVDYSRGMPQVFLRSKINLNITLRSILSGIPLRCLDIMGAGGFLLSNYQPELDELFVNGQEMVLFTGREDLMAKAEYYLVHEKERTEIAVNGKRKVDTMYSFDKKFTEMLAYI